LFVSLLFSLIGGPQIAAQNKGQPAVQDIAGIATDLGKRQLIARLEKLIPQLMKEGDVPGLSIALIRDAKVSWHKEFGVKNAETKEPLDESTVFEAASLSKPVFAYAALKLIDRGKLDLNRPLTSYLSSAYLQGDERVNLITTRMVLDHTTGFQNEVMPGRPLKIYFTPGEKFSYSGEGFLYLQKVVEHITGEPLDVFMKKTVFDSLGMNTSSFVWQVSYETLKASGHNTAGVVGQMRKPTVARSASSLHTTALDYAKFVIAVMNRKGLRKETAKQILQRQVRLDETCFSCIERSSRQLSQALSWGLGWALEHTGSGDAIWHWGENNGEFQNFVMAYPNDKTGIIIFTNSGNGFSIIPEIVSQALAGNHPAFAWMGYELYNSPAFLTRRAELRPARTLYEAILVRGSAALEEYRELKKTPSGTVVLSERQMNSIGYWILGKKRLNEAIEVFKTNVEDYPSSADAYDSLGEGYMVAGNKPEAIKNYKRSLALNPSNDNARQMIQKLEHR
jgi:CubicO group peptidase (beta-lactamase class C family)